MEAQASVDKGAGQEGGQRLSPFWGECHHSAPTGAHKFCLSRTLYLGKDRQPWRSCVKERREAQLSDEPLFPEARSDLYKPMYMTHSTKPCVFVCIKPGLPYPIQHSRYKEREPVFGMACEAEHCLVLRC